MKMFDNLGYAKLPPAEVVELCAAWIAKRTEYVRVHRERSIENAVSKRMNGSLRTKNGFTKVEMTADEARESVIRWRDYNDYEHFQEKSNKLVHALLVSAVYLDRKASSEEMFLNLSVLDTLLDHSVFDTEEDK
jgi:heme-degrading monooxygenase HmoA